MCYIKYHPLDSARELSLRGVIFEGVLRESGQCYASVVGSVLLKGVRDFFRNFLKRALTNRKIDAILDGTVRFWSGPGRGMRRQDGAEPCCAIERLREAATIPIQDR